MITITGFIYQLSLPDTPVSHCRVPWAEELTEKQLALGPSLSPGKCFVKI